MSVWKLNDFVQVNYTLTGVWRDGQIIELFDVTNKAKIHILNFTKKYDIDYDLSKILF